MDQDDGCFPIAPLGETHPAERQIGEQVLRSGLIFLGSGEGRNIARDESVDLGIGHVVVRQNPEQRLYRMDRVRFSNKAYRNTAKTGRECVIHRSHHRHTRRSQFHLHDLCGRRFVDLSPDVYDIVRHYADHAFRGTNFS